MSDTPELDLSHKENWGSKIGVVLAVAGSAVGLGNFLRFPGQAVNNGGGAFMIPYMITFLVVGIPVAWCEWTMGRLGGRYGQNSAPGIMFALWRRAPAKAVGAMALLIPVVIYMFYVLLEAWCLDYCLEFMRGGFAELYATAKGNAPPDATEAQVIVGATDNHFNTNCGLNAHGALFEGSRMLWLVLVCFLVNFVIIYRGVTRGIESFCKVAMPALLLCAVIILIRVLTLPGITAGLGFMWNPQWETLRDPQVWVAASGQIFFSLSVGFGLILCYSSYLRRDDDVVLTSLSASSTNEFCEVILGGMIVVPAAFLFLGAANAKGTTFGLGFITIPAIMNFMPGGSFFGAMWFGLLFLAAVTSSLSMLQPAIAFLEDGFGLRRRASVALLGLITACGALPIMYFSKDALALDHSDLWCNLLMIVAATSQALIFGWIIGAERGLAEANRGADFQLPKFIAFVIRYVTPTFLLLILAGWSYMNLPDYLDGMNPEKMGSAALRGAYTQAIQTHFAEEGLEQAAIEEKVAELLGSEDEQIDLAGMPEWVRGADDQAAQDREVAVKDANIARSVLIAIIVFLILLYALSDIACRNRIGRVIKQVEDTGGGWEGR
ncbi:MAG: sodium-dependent transporter [Phycisphaerales bacterium]|nr:MAG: sodium-dependent transporter [Phycisphaerales bacterium]